MDVSFEPTQEQRDILARLVIPQHVAEALQQPIVVLDAYSIEQVREALAVYMAQCGFDADYEPNATGRLIEDLIDDLFMS